jgi:3-hydroxybutyrate dehydrogenase
MRLAERTALVTGAARGLGQSIASALAREGALVAVADLDEEGAKATAAEIPRAVPVCLDVGDRDAVRATIDNFTKDGNGLDILVNNAGLQRISTVAEFDEDQWNLVVGTMLTGTFLCTKYALPHLRRSKAGRVINIASVHGLVASPFKSAYVAAKHGVLGLIKTMALEGADQGVSAIAVCPAFVRTPLVENQLEDQAKQHDMPKDEVLEEVVLAPHAVKRLLEPEEVAIVIAFLAGPAGSAFTGAPVTMDLGWTAR